MPESSQRFNTSAGVVNKSKKLIAGMQEIARNQVVRLRYPLGARFQVQSICCLAYVQALGTPNPVVSPAKLS